MAITKNLSTTSLSIEVESGTDSEGNITYSKKSFSGINSNSNIEDIYTVADAIRNLLSANSRNFYITETSILESQE